MGILTQTKDGLRFSGDDMLFQAGSTNGNAPTTLMTLKSDNKFGIGITQPLQRFHVGGVAYFSGGTNVAFQSGGDTRSNTAITIDVGDKITVRQGQYLRTLLWQDSANSIIKIGESGTSLITGINLEPGHDGSASGAQVRVYGGSTEYVRFDGYNKRVGIGTTAPSEKLDVRGKIVTSGRNYTYGQENYHIKLTEDSVVNAYVGNVNGSAYLSNGSYYGSHIYNITTGQVGLSTIYLASSGDTMFLNNSFSSGSSTAQGTVRMMIKSSGNVGIGEDNPSAPLHIATTAETIIRLTKAGYREWGHLIDTNGHYYIRNITGSYNTLTLTDDNKVGLGITNPAYKLDVLGSGAIQRIKTSTASSYAETHYENDNGQKLIIGSIGSTYSSSAWAGMRYIYSNSGDLAIKSAGAIRFYGNTLTASETARITSTGLGIGTTSPDSLLNIEGAKNTAILTLGSTTNNSSWAVGDRVGGIDFYSGDASGAGAGVKASISYEVSAGTSGATNALTFNTAGNTSGTNNTERMRIDYFGNVGIGTNAPAAKLSVAQPSSGDTTVLLGRRNGYPSIKADSTEGGYLILDSHANAVALNHYSSNNVWLATGGGNVGIGTTSPSEKLDVVGTYKLNGQRGLMVRSIDESNYFSFNDESTTADFTQQLPYTSGGGSVAKVDDSAAPAPGCFEITGSYNSDIHTSNRFVKIDINAEYTWEIYVKFISGTDTDQNIYLGWGAWNASKSYLGNVQRYWGANAVKVDADTNNSDWVLIRGTISGVGSSMGQFISGTEYVAPLVLLNYGNNTNVIRVCGLKLYKSSKNASKIQLGRSGASSIATLNVNTEYPQYRVSLENSGADGMRVRNDHGYLEIGALNSGHAHLQTDRSNFYFNKRILVDEGIISSYNENLTLQTSQSTKMTILNSNGNVGINNTNPSAKLYIGGTSTADSTTRAEMMTNSALTIRPHGSNSGNLSFAQVDGGNSIGMSFTNSSGTANWDIAMQPFGGNVGIGTEAPPSAAKLTVMGNQTFGLPGNGSNTSSRFISIEGNADGNGEGSGRIFFTEHNSTTASMDNYGMSIGYRGGGTSITGASGNTWTGLSQIANGEWGMFGHDNNATGAIIMRGDRAGSYIDLDGNEFRDVSFLKIRAGNGYGIRFWQSSSYSIYMSSSGGVRLDTSSDYNMYFKMNGGTNRGFVFLSSSTPVAQIDSTGKLYLEGGIQVNSTDSVKMPAGTTAQRPSSPAAGMLRYNSTEGQFEGYTTEWGSIGGGEDYTPLAVTKNGSNQFVFNFADAMNFSFAATGTWTFNPTVVAADVGKSGVLTINNTGATTPGALPSVFKTPNGDSIVFETDSGDTSIISYFIASTTKVLVNYVGNFS